MILFHRKAKWYDKKKCSSEISLLASTIATPERQKYSYQHTRILASILAKFFPSFSPFHRWIFFLFHFCFYYSERYKSNTSPLMSRHANWQLIFAEGWVIHTISFIKGYFTMYERLCVYINMEQHSKNEKFQILFWVYGSLRYMFIFCCCWSSSPQSHQKN